MGSLVEIIPREFTLSLKLSFDLCLHRNVDYKTQNIYTYYSKFDKHHYIDFHSAHCTEPTPLSLDK